MKTRMAGWAGVTAALLGLAAGPLNAAVIDEDFEGYTLGEPLPSQNDFYQTGGAVIQDAADAVNGSQVLEGGAFTKPLGLTGSIRYQLDLKLSGSDGNTQLYLYGADSSDRALWIQFFHNSVDGNFVRVAKDGAASTFPVIGSFETDQWYRLVATLYVDPENGMQTQVEEVKLFELDAGGVLGSQVGQTVTNTFSRGAPAIVDEAVISHSATTSGRYDNWTVTQVPEPASLSLVGLAGLGLLARRRKGA